VHGAKRRRDPPEPEIHATLRAFAGLRRALAV
jgi:hypothetical protein